LPIQASDITIENEARAAEIVGERSPSPVSAPKTDNRVNQWRTSPAAAGASGRKEIIDVLY